MDEVGYNNYYQVLNSKDYGIPQNRERVFVISIRKDIDVGFDFPKPVALGLKLKDMLEDEVDESYYLSTDAVDKLVLRETKGDVKEIGFIKKSENGTKHQSNTVYDPNSLGRTLTACDYKDPLKVKEDSKSETDDLDDIDAFLNED